MSTVSALLVNASWSAVQNLSRSFVATEHVAKSGGLKLSTRSFVAATDNVLQVEVNLSALAQPRGMAGSAPSFVDFNLSLWTTPELPWDACSGNTVAFSGCGAPNGSRVLCNSTDAGPGLTLFASRSNGFSWQQVRSRGKGGLFEHGNWNVTSQVLSLQVLSGSAQSANSRASLSNVRAVGDGLHDGGMPQSSPRRLPNRGNHGASAEVRVPVGGSITLLVAVYNQSHAGYRRGLARGVNRLLQLQKSFARVQLREAHNSWWAGYWNESFVSVRDFSPLLERYYYGSQYLLAVSSRAGHAVPGIFGPFLTAESGRSGGPASPWGGDVHMNYNGEAPFYGVGSSNHLNQGESYLEAMLAFRPQGRALARLNYGCPGIQVTGGIGPGGMLEGYEGDMGQRWQILMGTVPFVERWRYTHDIKWARNIGLPFVAEVLEFWECWLVHNESSGSYDDVNDEVSELGFFNERRNEAWGDIDTTVGPVEVNPIQTLAFLRYLLKGALEMAAIIDPPPEEASPARRALWRQIHAGLANYSVVSVSGGGANWSHPKPIYRCGLSGSEYYRTVHAMAPGTNPEALDLEIGRNTLTWMSEWFQGNEFPFVYTAAVRVRYNVTELLMQWESDLQGAMRGHYGRRGDIDPMLPPCDGKAEKNGSSGAHQCMGLQDNLYMRDGGGGIETIGATQSVNDMLMQSWRDVIELFPLVPTGSAASFGTLRAVGGFLVSASRETTGVVTSPVIVTSTVGGNAVVLSPWVGRSISVESSNKTTVPVVRVQTVAGTACQFATAVGETYKLTPGMIN